MNPIKMVQDPRVQQIWSEPALHNRAERRSVKLFGSMWKWDSQLLGIPMDLPTRYTRRHFDSAKFLFPKTRRQRRHKTRIMRDARQRGQAL